MKKAILATKVGMTQIFNEDGTLIPVTVLQAGPCVVTQVKTEENDGYEAVQVGYGEIREIICIAWDSTKFDIQDEETEFEGFPVFKIHANTTELYNFMMNVND